MYSRVITLAIGCMWLVACQMAGEPSAPRFRPQTKIGVEARCLKDALPAMRQFMKGAAELEVVTGAWECFDGALGLFGRKVRGAEADRYSAREVATFFESYFLQEGLKISDPLLAEIMRLKTLFVGGELDRITRTELAKLQEFARAMQAITVDLHPHMPVLGQAWQRGSDLEIHYRDFLQAQAAAEKAVAQLAGLIERNQVSYEVRALVRLFEGLESLYGEKWDFVRTLQGNVEMIEQLKAAMLGSEGRLIAGHEWPLVGHLGITAYTEYLHYQFFLADFESPKLTEFVLRSLDRIFAASGYFLDRKPGRALESEEIVNILSALGGLNGVQFDPELVPLALKVKRVFLGGSAEDIRPEDFNRGRTKIGQLLSFAPAFDDNRKLFFGNWQSQSLPYTQSFPVFQSAENDLKAIVGHLFKILESDYDLRDFGKMIAALEKSLPEAQELRDFNQDVQTYLPLVVRVKNLLLADQASLVKSADWERLGGVVPRLWAQYLSYCYFLKPVAMFWGAGLNHLQLWMDGVLEHARFVLYSRGNGEVRPIAQGEIRAILEEVRKFSPDAIALKFGPMLDAILKRFLTSPERRLAGESDVNLTLASLDEFAREMREFFAAQRSLDRVWSDPNVRTHAQLKNFYKTATGAEQELARIISGGSSLALDGDGRQYIQPGVELPYDQRSLERLNFVRTLVRWGIRAYASNMEDIRVLKGLTRTELTKTLFDELRPGLVEAGWVEPSNINFARNRFIEGNLFTAVSNGDDFLDFSEATNLSLLIWSGVRLMAPMQDPIEQGCTVKTTIGERHEVSCALEVMRAKLPIQASSMPVMASHIGAATVEQGAHLLYGLLKAAGWEVNEAGHAKMSDLGLVPHVLQYVESVFQRWDANFDKIIDKNEAMAAEPTFRTLLASVAGINDEQLLRAGFAYILIHETAPEDFIEFLDFASEEDSWVIHADRAKIGRILGYIADRVRSSRDSSAATPRTGAGQPKSKVSVHSGFLR